MKTNSKNKGSRFERTIAKSLEAWSGHAFSRTPGSGGWAKAKDAVGDIICTDNKHSRRFAFSIECKNYKDIRFEHMLLNMKSCKIVNFWNQATRDANKVGKLPLLIMKYNSMPKGEAFVIVTPEMYKFLKKKCKIHMRVTTPKIDVGIFLLKDITSQWEYGYVHLHARKLLKN